MQAPITDILHNGELENLENYKIFRRRYPKRQTFPIRTITDWYIQEIPMVNKPNRLWICLVGIHKNTMIRTSPIISIINSKKVCSSNCIYVLGPKAQKKENEMRGLGFAFESGFPDNWEELVEAALSFKEDLTERKNSSFRNDSVRIIDEEVFLKSTSDNLMKIDAKEGNFLDLDRKENNDDICKIEEKKDISISETKSKEEDQGPQILFKTEASSISSPVKRGSLNIDKNVEIQSLKEENPAFDVVSLANANVESHSLPTDQEVNIDNASALNDDLNILLDKVDSNKYSFKDDDFSEYDDSLLKEEQVTYSVRNPSKKGYPTVEEVIKNSPFKSPSERKNERLARAGDLSNNDLGSLNKTRINLGNVGELSGNDEKSFSKVQGTFAELGLMPQFNESVISSSKISDLSVTKMKDTPRKKSSQIKENTVESPAKKSSLDAVCSRDKHSSVMDSETKTTELYQTCLEDKIEFLNSFCFDEKISELPAVSQDVGTRAVNDEAQLNGKFLSSAIENMDSTLLCNNQPISDIQIDDLNEKEIIRKPNDKEDLLINTNADVLDLAKENKSQCVEPVKPDCGKIHVKNKDNYISNVGSKTEDEILFQASAKRRMETLKRHSFDDLNRKRCKEDLAEERGKPVESLNILNDHSGISLGVYNDRKPGMTATNNISLTGNAVGSDVPLATKNIINENNVGDYSIINDKDKHENNLMQNEIVGEDSDIQILDVKKDSKTAGSSATPTKKRMGLQPYHKPSKDNKSAVKRSSIRISLPSSRIKELSTDSQDLNSKSCIEDSLKTNNLVNQDLAENRSKIEENVLPVNETKEDGIDLNLPKSVLIGDDSLKETEDGSETKDSLAENLENEFPMKIVSSIQNEENVSKTRKPVKKRSRLIMPKKFKLSSKKKY